MKSTPIVFVGHGSPMNALAENDYTRALNQLAKDLPKPEHILVVSAHWETEGTQVLDLPFPPTIHDFHGFPEPLHKIQYPAPGSPFLVEQIEKLLGDKVSRSQAWGLDHGAWAVLKHMYPDANIPVTQLSLNKSASFTEHFALAERLRPLREQNVLILGSGNIVHNLRNFSREEVARPAPWAVVFDSELKEALLNRDLGKILRFEGLNGEFARMSVPTPEHYVPLIYALGAGNEGDRVDFPFEGIQNGSISMRTVRWT